MPIGPGYFEVLVAHKFNFFLFSFSLPARWSLNKDKKWLYLKSRSRQPDTYSRPNAVRYKKLSVFTRGI